MSLLLASNSSYAGVAKELAPALAAACPACQIFDPTFGNELYISALEGECAEQCQLDSEEACGCTIPEAAARAAAEHPDALWASRVEAVYSANGFGRGMMETTDIANSGPSLIREYGLCTDGACNHVGDLPFSQLPGPFGPFAAGAGAPTYAQRAAERAPASNPRHLGLNHTLDYAAVLASLPTSQNGEAIGQCDAACSSQACGFGFGLCSDLITPIDLTGLTGTGQITQVADTGLD